MSGHYCKSCNYKLDEIQEDQMLDGNLPNCPECMIEFGEKPEVKE